MRSPSGASRIPANAMAAGVAAVNALEVVAFGERRTAALEQEDDRGVAHTSRMLIRVNSSKDVLQSSRRQLQVIGNASAL